MADLLDDGVDNAVGVGLALAGEMEIAHRRFETPMAESSLDKADVEPRLQEVGSVAVAKSVDRHVGPGDPGGFAGAKERSLDACAVHRGCRRRSGPPVLASPAESREEKRGMPVGTPVAAKEREGLFGKRHGAILAAFTGAYMEKHRPRVDVVDGESERLAEAEATGIDEREKDVVVEGGHLRENPRDLLLGEDNREATLIFGAKNREELPLAVQDGAEVKLDTGVAQPQRRRFPSALVAAEEQIAFELRLLDIVGLLAEVVDKLAQRTQIRLLSRRALSAKILCALHARIPLRVGTVHRSSSSTLRYEVSMIDCGRPDVRMGEREAGRGPAA